MVAVDSGAGGIMAPAIAITNLENSALDLRRLMAKQKDGEVVRRLSAIPEGIGNHEKDSGAWNCQQDVEFDDVA